MRFLADENLERPIVERLRSLGHDVVTVSADKAGSPDTEVLAWATAESRVLLTNDKDFAELTFLQRKAAAGIVLIRLPGLRTSGKTERVLEVIKSQDERLVGVFTVIEADAIRRRPFLLMRSKLERRPADE
jgi:predicted nuclease of predicted toxin-antitoxin system